MLILHFLDVGNGDCIILEHRHPEGGASFGLIDCNRTSRRRSPARDKLIELGAEHLAFVFISHPDADHFTGVLDVLEHFKGRISQFGTYPFEEVYKDKNLLSKYLKSIKEIAERGDDEDFTQRNIELMQIIRIAYAEFLPHNWIEVAGDYNKLGIDGFSGVDFYAIMPPLRAKGPFLQDLLNGRPEESRTINKNSISSAVAIRYGGRTVILGGDVPNEHWVKHKLYRERANVDLKSKVVKLPHHGSKHDNTIEGLGELIESNSTLAVISADGKRHPDLETFALMDVLGAHRYCTGFSQPASKVKMLLRDDTLSPRLVHYLNVFADSIDADTSRCKGDIAVSIFDDGEVEIRCEFNTVCACTRSFSDLLALPIDEESL